MYGGLPGIRAVRGIDDRDQPQRPVAPDGIVYPPADGVEHIQKRGCARLRRRADRSAGVVDVAHIDRLQGKERPAGAAQGIIDPHDLHEFAAAVAQAVIADQEGADITAAAGNPAGTIDLGRHGGYRHSAAGVGIMNRDTRRAAAVKASADPLVDDPQPHCNITGSKGEHISGHVNRFFIQFETGIIRPGRNAVDRYQGVDGEEIPIGRAGS